MSYESYLVPCFSVRLERCFFFLLTLWRRAFNELCVCVCWHMCVRGTLKSVRDVQWVVLKRKTAWLMFCYFLLLLCSPCFPVLIIPPLSLSISSDKTVKIWLSKVLRKRWHPKWLWFLCQPSCCNFSHWYVTCSLLPMRCDTEITVSKAIEVFFVMIKWQSRGTTFFEGKKTQNKQNNLPFRFFYCQFKSAILGWSCLDKINRIFPAVDTQGSTVQFLSWHEIIQSLVLKGKKCPSVLSLKFQNPCGSEINSLKDIYQRNESQSGTLEKCFCHILNLCSSIKMVLITTVDTLCGYRGGSSLNNCWSWLDIPSRSNLQPSLDALYFSNTLLKSPLLSVYSTTETLPCSSRVKFFFRTLANLLFSLPQLFWTLARGGREHFYGSPCINTWCSTFWSLHLMPGSSSLCGCVLCGPLAIRLSSCWPCKQQSTHPVAQLR